MKKILFFFFYCMPILAAAQKKTVFEQLRAFEGNVPLSNYLRNPAVLSAVTGQIGRALAAHQQTSLADTEHVNVRFLNFYEVPPAVEPAFRSADTTSLHLYADMFEMDPFYYFRDQKDSASTALASKARTMFSIEVWLLTHNRKIAYTAQLFVVVSEAETAGIGFLYNGGIHVQSLSVLPGTFVEMIRSSFNMLFDPKNQIAAVQMKLQPAFLFNESIHTETAGSKRYFADTLKGTAKYRFNGSTEMIRFGQPVYEQVRFKGKDAQVLSDAMQRTMRDAPHFTKSDFVLLKQDLRDVVRDRSYLLQLAVQVDPENLPREESKVLTNFLAGKLHYLFLDKDTVASFTVTTTPAGQETQVYVNTLFNGFDAASAYKLSGASRLPSWQPGYSYFIEGTLNGRKFTVRCSGDNRIKEIFVDDRPAIVAQGRFVPEKFVITGSQVSPDMINALLLIGFNRFME